MLDAHNHRVPKGAYVPRWDPEWDTSEGRDMEIRLTYSGPLYAHNESQTGSGAPKTQHKHDLRRHFHKQLKALWEQHPTLISYTATRAKYPDCGILDPYQREGFTWQPLVRGDPNHSLMCRLDILMLRHGGKGGALADIDNRLKTLSDALQMVQRPSDLPFKSGSTTDRIGPEADENPFYALMENDKLISAVSGGNGHAVGARSRSGEAR